MQTKIVKANKSSLGKLIHWSSSRYNEKTKPEVIADIIFRVEKGEDCCVEYLSGVYSEGAHMGHFKSKWTGGDYTLEIKDGVATIKNGSSSVIPTTEEVFKLEKPKKNTFYIPAKIIYHKIEKYGIPIGSFEVIDQDVFNFHIEYENSVRHISKLDCEVREELN